MKRSFLTTLCAAIIYAGAISVFMHCETVLASSAGHDHAESSASHHHGSDQASHHSKSDQSKVHCQNNFGPFILTARVAIDPMRNFAAFVRMAVSEPNSALLSVRSQFLNLGFTDSASLLSNPRYLVLSVFRI